MKALISTILCIVLTLPWAMKVGVTTDFLIRQDYIAKNLCENRDKPEMHCNGKCVLMKKLNLNEDSQNDPKPLPEISRLEVSTFLVEDFKSGLEISLFQSSPDMIAYSDLFIPAVFVHDIFHPPELVDWLIR